MLVYFAIVLTVLMGFCGLAVDVGRMELRTNQLQAAADAGALAGANELAHGGSGSVWQTAADNDIAAVEAANGIPNTGSGAAVWSATYGPYLGDYSTVQVNITQSFPTIFLGLLTRANASLTLSVKAVAQMPPCMYFLGSPNLGTTYDFWNASAGFDAVAGCPVYSRNGVVVDGFAHMAGSQIRSSSANSASLIQGWDSYAPIYNVPVVADPLAYIPDPASGGCTNGTPISKLNQPTATTIYLSPGTYCGSVSGTPNYVPGPGANCGMKASTITPAVDIGGNYVLAGFTGVGCPSQGGVDGGNCLSRPTVNFGAGLYIFIGGVNFNCVTVTGNGVTMFFTKNNSIGYGQMRMMSSIWNVNAPNDTTSGGVPGISVMSNRAWTGGTQDFQWNYSTWYGDGVVYVTGTGINAYNLSMTAPNYLNVVASNLYNYDAEIRPANNYSNLSGGNPLHTVVSLVQ